MFERFTDRARRAVVLSQEEARLLNHNYIGTEHLLLALVRLDGVAHDALAASGVTLEGSRREVREIIGTGGQAPSGHIPFTPRVKRVLELSLRECTQRGQIEIGTEHLLLGLLREGEGVGAQVIVKLGASLVDVEHEVEQLLGADATDPDQSAAPLHVYRAGGQYQPLPGYVGGPPMGSMGSMEPPGARCSLCGRSEAHVARMLVARGVLLCDECVRDAARQLDAAAEGDTGTRLRFRRRDVGPSDKEAAVAAIERCFGMVFGATQLPPEEAVTAIEDGDRLLATVRAMRLATVGRGVVVNDVTVEQVRFVDADEAEVSLGIWFGGNPNPNMQPAHAVCVDGVWKVSRDTMRHLAGLAGVPFLLSE